MRLINCETRQLEWFSVSQAVKPPPYAILSHTWDGDTEVTYQDYVDFLAGQGKQPRKNWTKVEQSIEITLHSKERLKYIWIDTCCIDKSNTPELSEAINSMFNWYARAVELIAPPTVEFFDGNWIHFGNRNELADLLTSLTRIDKRIFEDPGTTHEERDILSRNAMANPDFTLTNNGVKINAQVRNIPNSKYLFLSLNCYDKSDGPHNIQGITLQLIGFNKYKRTNPSYLAVELSSWPLQPRNEFFISTDDTDADTEHLNRSENQSFVFDQKGMEYYTKMRVSHHMAWDDSTATFNTHGLSNFNACIWFRTRGRASEKVSEFLVACGTSISAEDSPWFCIVKPAHEIYIAAMDENWDQVGALGRRLGVKTSLPTGATVNAAMNIEVPYDGKDIYKQRSVLRISASMVKETGTKAFRIRIDAEPYDYATGCDNCCIFCWDPRALGCSDSGVCAIM
ncbi:HET domain-containing protein [Rutstroemia sp. NJR-2017a WRK4]|nr:HET domain-containing protein [Rutstroemia sp. NJR-2017a WRK4]